MEIDQPFGVEFITDLRIKVGHHLTADRLENAKRLAEAITVICAEYPEATEYTNKYHGTPWWAAYDRT